MYDESFEDIVFVNREKKYGAFFLRKKYNKHLFTGIIFTNLFFITISIIILYALKPKPDQNFEMVWYSSEFQSSDANIDILKNINDLKSLNIPAKKEDLASNNFEIVDSLVANNEILKNDTQENFETDSTGNSDIFSYGVPDGKGIYDYSVVEKLPVFQCGDECIFSYISKNIVIPKTYLKDGNGGLAYISLIIDKSGKVINVNIKKGITPDLDSAAVKVIREMPDWTPASQHGVNVSVSMIIPINFNFKE